MDKEIIKLILESKNSWIAIVLFVLYITFKLITQRMSNKKAKTREQIYIKSSKVKSGIIESIERRLKIIANRYNGDLPREAAIIIIQNIYFNFSTILINEIVDLRERNVSVNNLIAIIRTRISILNDDKMQELELFLFRNRELITFTSGDIIDPEIIIRVINSYATQNGMLASELRSYIEIEMNKVIKRLY